LSPQDVFAALARDHVGKEASQAATSGQTVAFHDKDGRMAEQVQVHDPKRTGSSGHESAAARHGPRAEVPVVDTPFAREEESILDPGRDHGDASP
jgi:hypothetical protein